MVAVNKDPFVYSRSKDGNPSVFKGLVQAGETAAIKVGELLTFDETIGYHIPVSAVADHRYMLSIAKEEQKAKGRGELTASRYIEMYSLDFLDVFLFKLAAAQDLALGDPFTLTASNSQMLTAGAGAYAVAINVGDGHYPQEEDTSIRSQPSALVTFNPASSWWGFRMSQLMRAGRRVITTTGGMELTEGEMYNTLVLFGGAHTVTLAPVKPGMDVIFQNKSTYASHIDPHNDDKIRLEGVQLVDGYKLSSGSAAKDAVRIMSEDADGFIAFIIDGTWTDGS